MKVVIFCGGMGTRLREETEFRPKPMVEVGKRPILWHIMQLYARHGWREFVLCLGYKGDFIRDYFLNYELRNRDVTVTLGKPDLIELHDQLEETGWQVTLAETGEESPTGTRLRKVGRYLGDRFLCTYGDGLCDVDLTALVRFHEEHGKLATVTAVRPSSRFGELGIESGLVKVFQEKPQVGGGWINGGFFVFEKQVLDWFDPGEQSLEQGLLQKLANAGQLAVYPHEGFWQCMDTYREMVLLNDLWRSGKAPWLR